MTRFPLLAGAALLALATSASATSFVATTDTLGGLTANASESTSDISSSFDDDKIVRAARDDAASFVASNGAIRGAQLEAALRHIRQQAPQVQADDQQLARAILAL
ncbi:DUF2388 domain-containing protein [Pseudomonas sp. MAP12]|uniref:DUF2388 domain-containing protein n=1 Tax=Geopseudomonas aromaticivorans TaxID=2849492 RepID=A0ABS6MWM0_9GAMM|nr:DUF2388 domain-containing protein [Pseudomonas aromaticivorans]MBV2133205.1 DUF2388 domain-containing protein [Pseudomonas aromaticivorans]